MPSCFIVDIYTNSDALIDLKPVILNNIKGRLGVTIDSIASTIYTPEEKNAVKSVIHALLSVDTQKAMDKAIKDSILLLSQNPRSFALLTKYINSPGIDLNTKEKTMPPNYVILHCEMGVEADLTLTNVIPATPGFNLTQPTLDHLRDEFYKQIDALPNEPFEVLYIGGGHGGDVKDQHNLRRQMNGIKEENWNTAFDIIAKKSKISAELIISESCYSAAYAKEFQRLLTNEGLCLCNVLECTPFEGLLESSVQRALVGSTSELNPQTAIPIEEMTNIILHKFGIPHPTDRLSQLVIDGLTEVATEIFNDPHQLFTEEKLSKNPALEVLFNDVRNYEVTYDTLNDATNELKKEISGSKAINLWDYFEPIKFPPKLEFRSDNSVINMRNDIQVKLIPAYGDKRSRLVATAYAHAVVAFAKVFNSEYTRQKTPEKQKEYLSASGIDGNILMLSPAMMAKTTNHSFENMEPRALVVNKAGDTITSTLRRLNNSFMEPTAKCYLTKNFAYLPSIVEKPDNADESDWQQRRDIQKAMLDTVYKGDIVPLPSQRLYAVMEQFSTMEAKLISTPGHAISVSS